MRQTVISVMLLFNIASIAQVGFDLYESQIDLPFQRVRSADFNNDGKDDLVIATIDFYINDLYPDSVENVLYIYFQNDHDELELHQVIRFDDHNWRTIKTLDIADFDGDGNMDFVVGKMHTAFIFCQNNDHYFEKSYEYNAGSSIEQINCTDINGDNRMDLLLSGYNGFNHLLYQKVEPLLFDTITLNIDYSVFMRPVLIDLNNDRLMDLIYLANNRWGAPLYYILNDTVNHFNNPSVPLLKDHKQTGNPDLEFNFLLIDDMNNDHRPDIVLTAGFYEPKVYIYYQKDILSDSFDSLIIDLTIQAPASFIIDDINNDGLKDLILDHGEEMSKSVVEQTNLNVFSDPVVYPSFFGTSNHYNWTTVDINNDDFNDIISSVIGSLLWYINTSEFADVQYTSTGLEFELYPNPVNDFFYVDVDPNDQFENLSMTIFNSIGKPTLKMNLNNGSNSFDLSVLNEGIYLYRIMSDKLLLKSGKFVKAP